MEWISEKILKYLNYDNGVYIECGANDGLRQSNTFLLENNKNWSGFLIEPSESAFNLCLKNRSQKNIILNYALVSNDYSDEFVYGDFDGELMSSINGVRRNNVTLNKVKAKTLTKILDEYKPKKIDFFSLDVEGYELDVLNGLDFTKYSPSYVLIEIYAKDYNDILEIMTKNGYILLENLSDFNLVNNPHWDGTHNDFLFKKMI